MMAKLFRPRISLGRSSFSSIYSLKRPQPTRVSCRFQKSIFTTTLSRAMTTSPAFAVYSRKMRAELGKRGMASSEIAKLIGEHWEGMTVDEKREYEVQANATDRFAQLVSQISKTLGPSTGLDSSQETVDTLKSFMAEYKSNESEWTKYAFKDPSLSYTRNFVDRGTASFNLLILVWTPGKMSPIHDHANSHCLMKILKGTLSETTYSFPEGDNPPQVKKTTSYTENEVAYIADTIGIHRVQNLGDDYAVSLHLYTPPNAENDGCELYNERDGRSRHVDACTYYSSMGEKN